MKVEHFDVMTRKIMTKCNRHHPHSSVRCLYLPRTVAGRGLINIEHLFYQKIALMAHHLSSSAHALVRLCYDLDQSLPPRVSILSRAKNYCSSLLMCVDVGSCPSSFLKQAICERQLGLLVDSLTV